MEQVKKVVINSGVGGFGLSSAVLEEYFKRTGKSFDEYSGENRDDAVLIDIIEEFGIEASGYGCNKLKIIEIPFDVDFVIMESDSGAELIVEKHRTWE